MSTLVFDPTQPVAPTEADAQLARDSACRLALQLLMLLSPWRDDHPQKFVIQ
jgi:hypothetical protein